jgi:MFS family permease
MSASGLGALLGALALLGVAEDARNRRIGLGIFCMTLGLSVMGHAKSLLVAATAMGLASFGVASAMGVAATIIQASIPDALRGRIMSVHQLMFVGIMPISALLVPGLAERVGLPRELQLAGLLYALLGALLLHRLCRAEQAAPRLVPPEAVAPGVSGAVER